jgi:hypothetical protein
MFITIRAFTWRHKQASVFFLPWFNHAQRKRIDDFNELLEGKNSISINQTAPVLDFCLRFDMADFTKARTVPAA